MNPETSPGGPTAMTNEAVKETKPVLEDRDRANAIREAMHDGNWGMDANAHDWHADHPLLQALAALRTRPTADLAVAVEALMPFAELDRQASEKAESMGCKDGNAAVSVPRIHLRKASAALSKLTGGE